ncbi:uncharacterized protein TA08025 [Theileria annulata]|uniref:Uncharacterized protein n=1 Tax=Theileria annulata TaxID=5874 RepID=Q4U9V2_THEAN|nr:uncharacterized protein TA08025 [Theileria annulata]CAI76401.1 hypothetical protein TA08025 [Theileria annulata]|eukprot:XP_953026.1 hypothetical protein TA08025 [Theileria annulata]
MYFLKMYDTLHSNNYNLNDSTIEELSRIKLTSDCSDSSPNNDRKTQSDVSELFLKGISTDNYGKFCKLFSRVLFNGRNTCSKEFKYSCSLNNILGNSQNKREEFEDDGEFVQEEFDGFFWDSLEWFVSVLDELNRFESLGFGLPFLYNNLKTYSEALEQNEIAENSEVLNQISHLKRWIDFINIFRDANSSIYTTYLLLERMEMKLNYIKCKSIKVLHLKLSNTHKSSASSSSVTSKVAQQSNLFSPLNSPFEHFEYTPTNTPSSTTTISDRSDIDLLHEIWDTKLCKMRIIVFNKFRRYIIRIIDQLKNLYPRNNYYQLIHYILYTKNKQTLEKSSVATGDVMDKSGSADNNMDYVKGESVNSELEPEPGEDILDYLKRYYSSKNMNEENAESYVRRIMDLTNRLIPKFVKVIKRLPVYYEAYLNALVCNNIQDGMFQLISSSTTDSNSANLNNQINYKDKDSYREGRDSSREESTDYKCWFYKINLIMVLSRTNLELIDMVRCSFGDSRKLVVFTQGTLKDLFTSPTHNYSNDMYMFKESIRDKDTLIKNDREDKTQKEDEEILNTIYYSYNNLNQVVSEEIDKFILFQLPSFSWYPKLVKYQLPLSSAQTFNYPTSCDDLGLGADLITSLSTESEYVEYLTLEEKVWVNRLNMFNRVNERNIRNFLLKRNNNTPQVIKYDSSGLLNTQTVPFNVLLDYTNYIPIKYIYSPEDDVDKETELQRTGTTSNHINGRVDRQNKKDKDEENDWLIRLFNNNNNKIMKSNCIDIEIERDLFPGFYLFNNFKLNCLILPIHENTFQTHETFINFSKLVNNKVDLIYPSYSNQISKIIFNTVPIHAKSGSTVMDELDMNKEKNVEVDGFNGSFRGKFGDFFTTQHTNLVIGTRERMTVNLVFHLVCCDTTINDDINPIEYAEDTEVILKHMQKIQPILNGISSILSLCNQFSVHTVHIPASLKCCYKVNQCNSHVIQSDFQYQPSNFGSFASQNFNTKDSVFECNSDYVRCLAVVSHIASLLNKNKYSIKNFNFIFPNHLKHTLLPKTAANILSSRVDTF